MISPKWTKRDLLQQTLTVKLVFRVTLISRVCSFLTILFFGRLLSVTPGVTRGAITFKYAFIFSGI